MRDEKPGKRTLADVLAETSDTLFPDQLGNAPVRIDSHCVDGDTALHVMVWRNDRAAVRLLIEAGADVNAMGDMGETPLHVAVRKGDREIVQALLAAGADAAVVSEFGHTVMTMPGIKVRGLAQMIKQARRARR